MFSNTDSQKDFGKCTSVKILRYQVSFSEVDILPGSQRLSAHPDYSVAGNVFSLSSCIDNSITRKVSGSAPGLGSVLKTPNF